MEMPMAAPVGAQFLTDWLKSWNRMSPWPTMAFSRAAVFPAPPAFTLNAFITDERAYMVSLRLAPWMLASCAPYVTAARDVFSDRPAETGWYIASAICVPVNPVALPTLMISCDTLDRSEERRVGTEC